MDDHEKLTQAAWQVLVCCASNRQTIRYSDLADAIGLRPGALRSVGHDYLDPIVEYCRANGVPRLTVIVVTKNVGEPSAKHDDIDLYGEREKVYDHNWYTTPPWRPAG